MKILIVVPRFINNTGEFYQFPLGIGYVAGALRNGGYDVEGLNLNYVEGDEADICEEYIRSKNIDIVLTGGLSPFRENIQKIFVSAKKGNPACCCIAGGGVVGADPLVSLGLLNCDIGIVGEAEETVLEVISYLVSGQPELSSIDGIVYMDKGHVRQTRARAANKNIDSLPWPELDIFDIERHINDQTPLDHHFFQNEDSNNPRSIDIITSRSCPFMCTFCFHPVGKVYRERDIDDIITQLKHYIEKYNINMVSIIDELFSLKKDRLKAFCRKIKPLGLKWMVQLHVRTADPEVLRAMKDAGCVYISYGIESASQPVLESMAKKSKVEDITETLRLTYELGIGIQGNLIFGDTAETLVTANESFRWWAEHRDYQIYLSKIQVFPGSPDYIMAVRDGIISDRDAFSYDLPANVNISSINKENISSMMFQLKIHGRTLLNAVWANFQEATSGAYQIDWQCPRCNHENSIKNATPRNEHKHFIRMFCRSCRSRFDIINELYAGEELSNMALIGGGSIFDDEKIEPFVEIKSRSFSADYLINDKHSVPAVDRAGRMLLETPFSPNAHYEFAVSLMSIGGTLAAAEHFKQALRLCELLEGRDGLRSDLPQDSHSKIQGFLNKTGDDSVAFVSHSEAPPPARASRGGAGYVNRDEPDFPDFSMLDVSRKSIQA